MNTASLYTRVARYCDPCPRHHQPRLHSFVLPPAPSVPFEMQRVKSAKVIAPMTSERRTEIYRRQNAGVRLPTKRQIRQLMRMGDRETRRTSGGTA